MLLRRMAAMSIVSLMHRRNQLYKWDIERQEQLDEKARPPTPVYVAPPSLKELMVWTVPVPTE
jgi:hypothetical protein